MWRRVEKTDCLNLSIRFLKHFSISHLSSALDSTKSVVPNIFLHAPHRQLNNLI